eukprot:2529118-Rhodomonas_salina.3
MVFATDLVCGAIKLRFCAVKRTVLTKIITLPGGVRSGSGRHHCCNSRYPHSIDSNVIAYCNRSRNQVRI